MKSRQYSNHYLCRLASAAAVLALTASSALAVTAMSGNTEINVDNTDGGLYEFTVNGVDHLEEFQIFFRDNTRDTRESPLIGTGSTFVTSVSLSSATSIAVLGTVNTNAGATNFDFELVYNVSSGPSQVDTSLVFTNNSSTAALDLTVFHFYDFNLDGLLADDTASWVANTFTQTKAGSATQVETAIDPPDLIQTGIGNIILNSLNDASLTTLNGNAIAGPGHAEYAFQQGVVIPAGGTTPPITTVTTLVPEPTSMASVLLSGLVLTLRRRRKHV